MAFRQSSHAILAPFALVLCGAIALAAWQRGLWGLLTGALLITAWIATLIWWGLVRPRAEFARASAPPASGDDGAPAPLLDAAPTPLVAIEGGIVHALNRAARTLFATDDRVVPPPADLLDPGAHYLGYEGRRWRVDRVEIARGAGAGRTVAALIDIEQEERTAEARATAEMIQILGHELLNGLAPIASLAESGAAAAVMPDGDPALLADILGTLARRAEGLQRFTTAYRALARLPEPVPRPVRIGELAADLARLFSGRWPDLVLEIEAADDLTWSIDRDQVSQALWALLQNAAEAMPGTGAGRILVTITQTEGGLSIRVRDNGRGIPPGTARDIFRPFHSDKPDGTGIGLSLARQIALAHGGALTLEPGEETTFHLLFPAR
ncbi:sensor histidine kinase [Allosphingosinicella deserti]|uniref:histidine kinase n=1 Tax=Allosphingosinicella deserti TaxID=2116704 RepID=A0A2P7QR33_9SPHN|nr:HAMP domain-containing sensor histidine kinase [Sphingomonas deserti]PSJ40422.1 ATP-binding protein [Sphingomonas deserti]